MSVTTLLIALTIACAVINGFCFIFGGGIDGWRHTWVVSIMTRKRSLLFKRMAVDLFMIFMPVYNAYVTALVICEVFRLALRAWESKQ